MNQVSLSKEQIKELARCYYDPVYYIENYTWIEFKEENRILPTKLFPYQKKILQWLINRENGIVLKSRRVGASTVVALYLSWLINFRRGVSALLISRNEDSAKRLLNKVKFSFYNLKKHTSDDFSLAEDAAWMLNNVVINQQQLFAVGWQDDEGNNLSTSEVAAFTTTKESARGDSATFVFMDELAFLQDQEETSRSARLTALRGGHWLAVSTPNGVGDVFHSMCMMAERHENTGFNYLRVHWSEAGVTEDMITKSMEGLTDASRLQEMEMEFLSSGDPVFNHMHLAACFKPADEYPEIEREISEYREKVLNNPKGDLYYYSGVDSAVGKLNKKDSKRDYHCFTALTKSGIQAFTYYSKTESLTDWAGNIEQMPSGQAIKRDGTVSKLHKEYPGILYVEINGPGQTVYVNHQLPHDGYSEVVPKQTTFKSKDQIIRQLVLAVEAHAIIITDRFTYQCMTVFQRGSTPGTYSAPLGDYYDDPVIALALAWDALLQSGVIEFSWGAGTDNLQRADVSSDRISEMDISRLGYGPSILQGPIDSTERMSNYFGDGISIIDTDLDITRIKEPEMV